MAYIYSMTDTWNDAGVDWNAIKINVTNTASGVNSMLLNLQVGGLQKFGVAKDGSTYLAANANGVNFLGSANDNRVIIGPKTYGGTRGISLDDRALAIGVGGTLSWSSQLDPSSNNLGGTITTDQAAFSDNYTIAMRSATNAMTWRVYNTYTDTSNYARGELGWSSGTFVLKTAGIGTSSRPNFQIDSANRSAYIASPTAAQIRDIFISFGMMSP
jgi:hypothetical protein